MPATVLAVTNTSPRNSAGTNPVDTGGCCCCCCCADVEVENAVVLLLLLLPLPEGTALL
jgi:hypothetical protein